MAKENSKPGRRRRPDAKVLKPVRHPDAKVLATLVDHYDSAAALARELELKPQAFNNWMRRGIAPARRGDVYKLLVKHRCAPPLEWLTG
jgi:hypothetical protein